MSVLVIGNTNLQLPKLNFFKIKMKKGEKKGKKRRRRRSRRRKELHFS